MKAILLADLHLHPKPAARVEWVENLLNNLLKKYSKDHMLFLMGDALEVRDKVDSYCLNTLISFMGRWAKNNKVVAIAGQHDSYLPGMSTYQSLESFDNITIVDNAVYKLEDIYFVPFQRDLSRYREMLDSIPDNSEIFTHCTLREAIMQLGGDGNSDMLTLKEFSRFKQTYSGDIHGFVDYVYDLDADANFSYIGAPDQRDFRDKNVKGAFGKYADGKFTRIFTKHPVFLDVESEDQIPDNVQIYGLKTQQPLINDHPNLIGEAFIKPVAIKHFKKDLTIKLGDDKKMLEDFLEDTPDHTVIASTAELLAYIHKAYDRAKTEGKSE